jgi:hypothetical protein
MSSTRTPRRSFPARAARSRPHARRPVLEGLEDRVVPSGYTFTKIAELPVVQAPAIQVQVEPPALNNLGQVAFVASGSAGSVTDFRLYRADQNGLTQIVREGDVLPGTGSSIFSIGGVAMNDAGTVVFEATLLDGTRGIFSWSGGAVVTVFHPPAGSVVTVGNISPDLNNGGTVVMSLSTPQGGVVYTAPADGSTPPTPIVNTILLGAGAVSINDAGLIVFKGGTGTTLYATDGTSVTPLFDVGGPSGSPAIGGDGTVAVIGGPSASNRSLFTDDGTLHTLIQTPSADFSQLDVNGSPSINADGELVFAAQAASTATYGLYSGPDPVNDLIISQTHLLDSIYVPAVRRLSRNALNDNGQIAFQATASTITRAIYLASPILPSLSIDDVSGAEGDSGTTNLSFTVTLSEAVPRTVSVHYDTADGTATAGTDYSSASGTLSFAPGETTKTITVPVNGDATFEPDETFHVVLSSPSRAVIAAGTGTGTGTGTIVNDDPRPSLSIHDVSSPEGDAGPTPLILDVTLSNPSSQGITVDFATEDGTAAAAGDYVASSGTLSFAPGEVSKSITLQVVGDTIDEPDETFSVVLSNAANASIGAGTGTATIQDDDLPPQLTIHDVTQAEGDAGTSAFTFTVDLSGPSGKTITVHYATADGTAAAGSDYVAADGSLTFDPGESSRTITVAVDGDTTFEPDETFFVRLSNPVNATIAGAGAGTGTGTITDDDPAPSLSIDSVASNEGNTGTTPLVFTVRLSSPSGQAVTVHYATADGTAAAGSDYTATSGSLTFAPGVVAQTITVPVSGDTAVEPDEAFLVNLSDAAGATLANDHGTGTILNDDTQAVLTLSIDDMARFEGNSGTTQLVFTVSLSSPSNSSVTVAYGTANDSAKSSGKDPDFTRASGTLTFAPGETTRTVTVLISGDTAVESDETFFVNLSGASGATIADGQGVGTILNDDIPPALTIDDVSLAEGDGGTTAFVFTVSLSSASTTTVTVKYATAADTAASGGKKPDFTRLSGVLTFAAGETTKRITVLISGDTTVEPDETFFVNLSGASGATIADGQGVGTILDDDGVASGPA